MERAVGNVIAASVARAVTPCVREAAAGPQARWSMQLQDSAHIEAMLRQVWAKVLATPPEQIPSDRNFFSLGGDSVLLMQVMEGVNSLFFADSPDAALTTTDFLTYGTIRQMTGRLAVMVSGPRAVPTVTSHHGAVAIIGMAVRVPGADTPEAFWRNLREGVETLQFFSDAELIAGGATAGELTDPRYVRCAGFVEHVQQLDAEYFGLSPAEAAFMAPEQRLLLECAHQALERAGYGVRRQGDRVGVFAGFGLSTYLLDHFAVSSRGLESASGMRLLLGNTSPATRISYLLNLTGPSITLDTACSSSLVAVHQACRAISGGECEMALAGGATVRRFAPRGYSAEKGGIFSPDGHCRPFDRHAQGTVASSGAAMVLLKPLDAAIAHGDSICAVIRGTAINNDGGEKVGYTAPSVVGQAAVIKAACSAAGIEPRTLQYVETHGTATELGDMIEIAALNSAFGPTGNPSSCALGTLKANLGHLEAAAGVAGLIKVALALQHREFPPAIHFQHPSPRIDFSQTPFHFNRHVESWPAASTVRRAGVSSFGIGGTNAHAVLEEAPEPRQPGDSQRQLQLLVLSARSAAALHALSGGLAAQLTAEPGLRLADVAYSLQVGRAPQSCRRCCVAASAAEAVRLLGSDDNSGAPLTPAGSDVPIVFMFPGQGSQHTHMARGIHATEPVFREHFAVCADLLRPALGFDLRDFLFRPSLQHEQALASDALRDTALCQPILFAVEYSLARLWQAWGVVPAALIGHSLGEYVAACIAGALSLEDALALLSARGSLMRAAPAGRMLAVALSRDEVLPLLGNLDLAAVNADRSCVLAGSGPDIQRLEHELAARGTACSLLETSHAFHSSLMETVLPQFDQVLQRITSREVRIPFVSNLTGEMFEPGAQIPRDYWLRQLRGTVEFARGIHRLMPGSPKVFLEVGPGTVLSACLRNISGSQRHTIVSSCRHPRAAEDDSGVLMRAVGRVWQVGGNVDWERFNAVNPARRIPLPTYPFERQRHWIEPSTRAVSSHAVADFRARESASDGLQPEKADNMLYVPAWKQRPASVTARAGGLGACLLFDDGSPLCEALALALASRCCEVVRVKAGQAYAAGPAGFTVDAAEPSHYSNLMNTLATRDQEIEYIVHAWQMSPRERETSAGDDSLALGFYSLLYLCQALEARHGALPIELVLLTGEAQMVLGDERGDPFAAMLAACARVIAREFPNVHCRCVDLPPCTDWPPRMSAVVEQVVSEALGRSREPLVAYRGRACFLPTYEALSPLSDSAPTLLRAGGIYLITGGLGGIGLTLAELLARSAAGGVVLTGRSDLPGRELWDEWLEIRAQDPISRCIRQIRAIEKCGTDVLVLRADVTQPGQMHSALSQAVKRFGALHGVIHAAGVPGSGVIALKSRAIAQRVLAPKVVGATVLLQNVKDLNLDLDFFVVCSSIAAIFAPPGQLDYCAANAFLDAFAHVHDRADGTRFISINWDGWKEVGMAVRTMSPEGAGHSQLQEGLSCRDGAEVFRRILAAPRPQWVVSTRRMAPDGATHPELASVSAVQAVPQHSSSEPQSAGNTEEQMLAQIWRDLLGVYEPAPDDDFFALGGDSLLAIQLSAQVEARFGVGVPVRQLLETPTIASLAAMLRRAARALEPAVASREL